MTRYNTGPARAPSVLTINLGAIADNYRILLKQTAGKPVCAVVKADAYGLGTAPVVETLWNAGCRTFFTALLDEAIKVREILPDAEVGVLNGLGGQEAPVFEEYGLLPVLNDIGQIQAWGRYCAGRGKKLPASIHVDTGMSRLGLPHYEFTQLTNHPEMLAPMEARHLMSHLACAETPDHPMNNRQREAFARVIRTLPGPKAMLAASSGIFLGKDFHFDMVRPGVALFGGAPDLTMPNPLKQVVALKGKILQIREVAAGQTVGYGAYFKAPSTRRIATVAAGYADGYLRSLSSRGRVLYEGKSLPVVGRISMDLITVDVTECSGLVAGGLLDLIGPGQDINDLARQGDTIPYEILTSLGARYARVYEGE